MRQFTVSFPTQTQNEVCATNATAASGTTLALNGSMSFAYQGNNDPTLRYVKTNGGYAQPVSVFSTGNISTSTFSFTGLDINGYALSTSFAGPTGTAVPTKSTTEFSVVFTASVGNTAATVPFTVGFGPSGITRGFTIDRYANPVNITYAVVKTGTSGPVTFQHAFENSLIATTAPTWATVTFSSGVSLASQTTATSVTVSENPAQVRAILLATAAATTVVTVTISQAGP